MVKYWEAGASKTGFPSWSLGTSEGSIQTLDRFARSHQFVIRGQITALLERDQIGIAQVVCCLGVGTVSYTHLTLPTKRIV